MSDEPCPECAAIAGEVVPDGGMLLDDGELVVHAVLGGAPLPGWVVVAPRQHVERLEDLTPAVRDRLFALAARVGAAQRATLGAEKVYLALFAEIVPHVHVHVVPRHPDTPAELRGARCFLSDPALRLSPEALAASAHRLGAALERDGARAAP